MSTQTDSLPAASSTDDTEFVPAAQPATSDAPAIKPQLGRVGYKAPTPRAVSVAGPIPDPQQADEFVPADQNAEQPFAPPIVDQSLFKDGIINQLQSEPSDQGFDDGVRLNMGDLKWPLMAFKGVTPDVAAKVDQLAKSNGVPFSVANEGKDDLDVLDQAKKIYASLSATDDQGNFIYPSTRAWLNDPINMAKSKDDLQALTALEAGAKAKSQAGESNWYQTARSALSGIEKPLGSMLRLPAIVRSAAVSGLEQLGDDPGPIGQTVESLTGGMLNDRKFTDNADWLDTFFGATRYINQHADANSGTTIDGRTMAGDFENGHYAGAAQMATIGLLSFAPTVAAAAIDPALGLTEGAGTSSASAYADDIDNGETPRQASEDAILNAGVNVVGMHSFGTVGQIARLKSVFATPVARESASALWGRIAKQTAISATQGGFAQAGIQAGTDAASYATGNQTALDNETEKIVSAGVLGFLADGAMASPLGALQGLRQLRQQEAGSNAWNNLSGPIADSKLRQRDPDAFADLLTKNLTEANQPTTVGVDGDKLTTFFQSQQPGELNKFAADMGIAPETITDAANTGGSVDLPIGPYRAKYEGTDLDKAIFKDLRFTPGGLSENERQDMATQVQASFDSIQNELAKTGTDEQPLPQQIKTMRDTLMANKEAGGMGYSADQADSQLAVLLAGVKHTVARPGESTSQVVSRLGLALKVGGDALAENPDARGAISFGDGETTIHLLKNADLSTFVHESGHLFLDQRQKLIDQGLATPQALADHQTLLGSVGVKPGEHATKDQTEKLVSSFESYLREGKAPSIELSGPFGRFRAWLSNIYRSVTALGAKPSDQVRAVFDRMLASEDDIAHAQAYYSRTGELLDLMKGDDADKQDVREKLAKVNRSALDKQVRAYLKSYLQSVGGVAAVRESAKAAVESQPIYKAIESAKDGKIDEDSLREALGTKGLNEFVAKFPNLVKKDGEHTLESLATQHDFESPETLGDNLLAVVPKAEAIKNYTDRLVAEKESQLRDEIVKRGATPADGVMHTDASLAYLIAETNLLYKQLATVKSVRIDAPAYRDAAKKALAAMPVKKAVRYSDFARTEARLAKRVLDLAKRGRWEDSTETKDGQQVNSDGALTTRRKQIAQHALVQEAIKARDERVEIVRRFSPAKLEPKLKTVDNEYVDPVRQILSTYGLSDVKPKTPYDLADLGDVDRVLFSQLPTWLIRGENAGDYRDLTWGQLQDVNDAARSVLAFGNDLRKSDLAMKEKTIKQVVDNSVLAINALPERDVRQLGNNVIGNAYTVALQKIDWTKSHITKFQSLCDILDNFSLERFGKPGIMGQLFSGMRRAEHGQSEMARDIYKIATPHIAVLEKATRRIRNENGTNFAIPGVEKPAAYAEKGRSNWTPDQLVSYLLNTGAEGNISALKNAFGHGPAEIDRIAQHFTTEELHAIDGLRDSIGALLEPMDATNFKLYNRHVEAVDAVPQDVTDKDGNGVRMKGGYWPLMFDYEINRLQGKYSDEDVLQSQIKGMMRSAKPEDGMTKSRVTGHSLAPRLDLGVFADHVDDTTRFIHMAPLTRDLDRVMQTPEWRDAVISKVGSDQYDQAREWLKDQANPGRKQTTALMRGVDKVADYSRNIATEGALGLNFVAGLKWRTSMINSAVALGGWRHIANGYKALGTKGLGTSTLGLSNTETWARMVEKSKLLATREAKGVRDLRNDMEKLQWNKFSIRLPGWSKPLTVEDFKDFTYAWAKMNDRAVIAPVWMGAYTKYLNEMGEATMTHDERDAAAVDYADGIVQRSQPSNLNVDLPSWQRNQASYLKLFTMFMSYPVTIANRFMYMAKAAEAGAISKKQWMNHALQEMVLEPYARMGITLAALGTLPTAAALVTAPMSNLLGGIPFLAQMFNLVTSGFDVSELSPVFDAAHKAKNLQQDIVTGKDVTKIAWDAARLTTYLTGLPVLNLAKSLMNAAAMAHGEKNPYK